MGNKMWAALVLFFIFPCTSAFSGTLSDSDYLKVNNWERAFMHEAQAGGTMGTALAGASMFWLRDEKKGLHPKSTVKYSTCAVLNQQLNMNFVGRSQSNADLGAANYAKTVIADATSLIYKFYPQLKSTSFTNLLAGAYNFSLNSQVPPSCACSPVHREAKELCQNFWIRNPNL